MKKLLLSIVLIFSLVGTAFAAVTIEEEGDVNRFLDKDTAETLDNFREALSLPGGGLVQDQYTGNVIGLSNVASSLQTVIQILKYAVSGLLALMLTIALLQLIAGSDNEESFEKTKTYLKYILIAVGIVFLAEPVFLNYLSFQGGSFLDSADQAQKAATGISAELLGIYRIIQSVIGIIAVFMIIFGAFKMAARSYDEENLDKVKNQIIYGSLGIILVILSETIVTDILFRPEQGIDPEAGKRLIISITNFISGFIVLASLFGLFYAGYLYVFSAVDEENTGKIKNAVSGAIIGILLASGAFAIVNTVIKLENQITPEVFTEDSFDR